MGQKISPNRRRSIAVLSQGQASRHSTRRRAYSIAPGEKLSPAAKARRSLAPRKSILKPSINLPDSTESSALGDETTTQSMDFTEVHSRNPRKSLARRVSFASHAHVRLFEIQEQNTNGSAEPASSPPQASSPTSREDVGDENVHPNPAFARRRSSVRRRSSTMFSEYGEQSMDMDMDDTAPLPHDFLRQNGYQLGASAVEDDEFTDEDDDDEDMEITEAIRLNIERKRSLSLGLGNSSLPDRRRSSIAPTTSSQGQSENQPPPRPSALPPHNDAEQETNDEDQDLTTSSAQSQSFVSEGSSGDVTQPMEFTVPMGRSLRPPEPPSDAWLQLRAMTHAGDEPYEPPPDDSYDDEMGIPTVYDQHAEEGEPMELTDAVDRLLKARSSLGLPSISAPIGKGPTFTQTESDMDDSDMALNQEQQFQDASFTSTEDSFVADDDLRGGDHTINVTSLIRASLGTQDSSMDVTSVYSGAGEDERVVKVPLASSVGASRDPDSTVPATADRVDADSAESVQTPGPSVFSAPKSSRPSVFSAPGLKTPNSVPRSPSKAPPSATIPKPFTFGLSRPSTPSRDNAVATGASVTSSPAATQPRRLTAAFAPPSARKSPMKRPAAPEAESAHQPSPAKRVAIGKLEPAKKAPFERAEPSGQPQGNRRASLVRRPSGYFAQRKSMGAGVLPPAAASTAPAAQRPGSPKKFPGLGLGRARASMGSAPSGQGLGIVSKQGVPNGAPLYPDVARIMQEDPPTPSRSSSPAAIPPKECERETLRQAIAVPSSTRGSPSPASPSPAPSVGRSPLPRRSASPSVAPPRSASPVIAPPGVASSVIAPLRVASPVVVEPSPNVSFKTTGIALSKPSEREVTRMVSPPALPNSTQQWQAEILEGDPQYNDDGPPISIEQFFEMTGIRFMDELTMPKPRQSMMPPPQLRSRSRRRSSSEFGADGNEDDPISLAEFSVAMAVELPRLELFTAVSNDLTAWIEESKKICLQAEKETEKVTPELFRDFVAADESEKALLIHQLKLIKANNYNTAKSQWYDWKTVWMERLYGRAEQEFAHLESDAQALAKIIKQAQGILPDLRAEYAQVMSELEREQANIAEIENSDQDYLNELKTTIAEQSSELEAFKMDVSESRAKLERFKEKLAEIDAQKQEASAAIAQSQYIIHIQKETTSAEVFRLQDELAALQDLHLWRTTKITAHLIEFVYASRYQVSIPCIKHRPILAKATVTRAKHARTRERDLFPRFTDVALYAAQQLVVDLDEGSNIRKLVERLGDFWSSCSQLRSQFTFLAIKYPLSVEVGESTADTRLPDLHAKATVLFPSIKGKAYINFILDSRTYSQWPMSIHSLKANVEIAYGRIEQGTILNAVRERLGQASSVDNHGCLLDACIEATEQYSDV